MAVFRKNGLCCGPLDVRRLVLSFIPVTERIATEVLSKKWFDTAADAALWQDLEVTSETAAALPAILGRGRAEAVRSLCLSAPGHFGQLLPHLPKCSRLSKLTLRGLRGGDFSSQDAQSFLLPSVSELHLEHSPYFILSCYSHHTGAQSASVPAGTLASVVPNVEDLTLDYLEVGHRGNLHDRSNPNADEDGDAEEMQMTSTTALQPQSSLEAEDSEQQPFPEGFEIPTLAKLRRLSLVAVVHPSGEVSPSWSSFRCRLDTSVIAAVAPRLETLDVRCPRLHLGRVSLRPGQTLGVLSMMCRKFCATPLPVLENICQRLPSLRSLRIASIKEGSPEDVFEDNPDLAAFMGIRPSTASNACGSSNVDSEVTAAENVDIHSDRRFHFSAGGRPHVLEAVLIAAARGQKQLFFETIDDPVDFH